MQVQGSSCTLPESLKLLPVCLQLFALHGQLCCQALCVCCCSMRLLGQVLHVHNHPSIRQCPLLTPHALCAPRLQSIVRSRAARQAQDCMQHAFIVHSTHQVCCTCCIAFTEPFIAASLQQVHNDVAHQYMFLGVQLVAFCLYLAPVEVLGI